MLRTLILAALAVLTAAPADAGLFRCRTRAKVVVKYQAGCAGVCPAPATVPRAAPQAATSSDAASFLAALNAWRASHGRPPVAWDATLAAYAATNTGVHAPGSSGGGSQCWASAGNLTHALGQWIASPAHAAILLAGNVVGASVCPSGATCNAR